MSNGNRPDFGSVIMYGMPPDSSGTPFVPRTPLYPLIPAGPPPGNPLTGEMSVVPQIVARAKTRLLEIEIEAKSLREIIAAAEGTK